MNISNRRSRTGRAGRAARLLTDKALAHPFSRRAFFCSTAVVGSLTFLGSVMSGRVMAFADEVGNTSFVVTILSRCDVAVLAVDVANGNLVVPGMRVTLRSLANDKVVEGTTDETGVVFLRIKDLAEDPSDASDGYKFWGRLSAYKEGYREYENHRVLVQGGPLGANEEGKRPANVAIPTRPAGSLPYVRVAAFDDDDIQYGKATFPVCAANVKTHTVTMQVMAATGTTVSGWLTADGKTVAGPFQATAHEAGGKGGLSDADAATAAVGSGVVFEFTGEYLREFAAGTQLEGHFSVGENTWHVPFSVAFCEPAGGLPYAFNLSSESIDLFSSTAATEEQEEDEESWSFNPLSGQLTLPPSWPIVGGAHLSLALPGFPVDLVIDPQGGYGFAIGTDTIVVCKNGKSFDKEDWEFMSRETAKDYRGRMHGRFLRALERYDQAKDCWAGDRKQTSYPSFGGASTKIDFGLQATGNYDDDEDCYVGDIALSAEFGFRFVAGKQFVLGPVPVFVSFDFSSASTLILQIPLSMQPWHSFDDPSVGKMLKSISLRDPDKKASGVGLVFIQRFDMGVSLGVGIKGFLSVAARGYGYIEATFSFVERPSRSYALPNIKVAAGVGVQVIVQVLLFKGVFKLAKKTWPNAYNNWPQKNNKTAAENLAKQAAEGKPVSLLGADAALLGETDGMVMVADEELCDAAEFTAGLSDKGAIVAPAYNESKATGQAIAVDDLGVEPPYEQRVKAAAQDADSAGDGSDLFIEVYDPTKGVFPSIEKVIFRDVVSDPRAKVVDLNGVTYLCRIVSVQIKLDGSIAKQNDEESGFDLREDKDGVAFFVPNSVSNRPVVAAVDGEGQGESGYAWDEDRNLFVAVQDQGAPRKADLGVLDLENSSDGGQPDLADMLGGFADYASETSAVSGASASVARTRIGISRFKNDGEGSGTWSKPAIVDWYVETDDAQYSRANAHDIDFDVVAASGYGDEDGLPCLHFAITSCVRPINGEKSLTEQGKKQYVSYVAVNVADARFDGTAVAPLRAVSYQRALQNFDTTCWNARIEEASEGGESCLVLAFLAYRENTALTKPRIETLWMKKSQGSFYLKETIVYADWIGCDFYVKGVLDLSTGQGDEALACLTDDDQAASTVFALHPDMSKGSMRFKRIVMQGVPSSVPGTGFVYTQTTGQVEDREGTLVSGVSEKRIMKAGFDASANQVYIDKEIGRTTASTIISSPKGGYLFAVCNTDSRAVSSDYKTECTYQVLAANLHDESSSSYGGFYPFAQLKSPIDDIECIASDWGAATFCYATIKDTETLKADIHHVVVPFVESIELDDVGCVDSFYGEGDVCSIYITTTNVGNVPLVGYTAHIWDGPNGTGNEIASIEVAVSDGIRSRLDDYHEKLKEDGAGTGEFVLDEKADQRYLYPGRSRTNRASFTLPSGISGEVELHVTIDGPKSDGRSARKMRLSARASAGPNGGSSLDDPCTLVDPVSESFQFDSSLELSDVSLFPSAGDYRMEGPGSSGGSGDASGLGSGGSNNAAEGKLETAKTGDSASLAAAAATAGIGAVVAGVSWYEHRRAQAERGWEEEDR